MSFVIEIGVTLFWWGYIGFVFGDVDCHNVLIYTMMIWCI